MHHDARALPRFIHAIAYEDTRRRSIIVHDETQRDRTARIIPVQLGELTFPLLTYIPFRSARCICMPLIYPRSWIDRGIKVKVYIPRVGNTWLTFNFRYRQLRCSAVLNVLRVWSRVCSRCVTNVISDDSPRNFFIKLIE